MNFTKMQGIGNDYIYVNGFTETVADPPQLSRLISDRHFGVGGDGLILILPSKVADVRMRMFNADGSESEMCGNGLRCLAKYSYEHGLSRNNPIRVETGRGVLCVALQVENGKASLATVNMSQPVLELAQIPVDSSQLQALGKKEYRLSLGAGDAAFDAAFVSMGNPHAVIFVPDVAAIEINRLGPLIEKHAAFPRRINVHWVQAQGRDRVTVRTWERGSGVTMACGTGACAVCVGGVISGRTDRKILTHLPGGDLNIEWRQADNNVYMTGPAVEVFSGQWPL